MAPKRDAEIVEAPHGPHRSEGRVPPGPYFKKRGTRGARPSEVYGFNTRNLFSGNFLLLLFSPRCGIRSSVPLCNLHPPRLSGTKALFLTVAALCLLALPLPIQAAVRFDAFLGYDGVLPQANWFPVVCEVQNDGPTFKAVVEVSPSQFGPGQRRALAVELPTGTTKRFALPVFSTGRGFVTWDARLLDDRGRVRAEARNLRVRRTVAPRIPIFAAVTRAVPALPPTQGGQAEVSPVVARLQPAVFPDTPLGLEGLNTIYLSSERALDLKESQVKALLAWLRAGGRLVVGVEQLGHLNGTDWLKPLLPCEVTGLGQASPHEALQEWLTKPLPSGRVTPSVVRHAHVPGMRFDPRGGQPEVSGDNPYANLKPDTSFANAPMQVASARLREGWVLIGSEAQPLVVSARRGRGELVTLLFSPELEPFLSWTNRPWFWARMADFPPELFVRQTDSAVYPVYGGYSLDSLFGAMIDSRQVRKLPVGWLLALLLTYLMVIGPLDYWGLKKINRQMWTWLTFPAYVGLFSVLIYFIGYKLRAGEIEYNELHVVDVIPGGDLSVKAPPGQADWRGSTYASLYSPANARYPLASEIPIASLRGEFAGGYGPGDEVGRTSIEQQTVGFRAEVSVPVWTSRLFVGQWWQRGDSPLRLRVTGSGRRYEVELENRTDTAIRPVRLVIGDRVFDLGEIQARQVRQVSVQEAQGQMLSGFLRGHAASFQNAAGQRGRAFGDSEGGFITDVVGGAMAASFPSLLRPAQGFVQFIAPGSLDLTPLLERGDAILLAWVPGYAPVKPMNRFSPRRGQRDTLFRLAVPVEEWEGEGR
jgi:hypothetical protein